MTTSTPTRRTRVTLSDVDPDVQTRAAERLALAHDQRIALRFEAQQILASLAKGLTAYMAAETPWPWPDSPAIVDPDPHNWRRVAKLAWLLARLDTIHRQIQWQASTIPMEPFWCLECEPNALNVGGPGWLLAECEDHDVSPSSAINWADALFGAK